LTRTDARFARKRFLGDFEMSAKHPLVTKLLCVALVVSVMFPVGRMLFPLIGHDIGETPFGAIEAVISTTLGFGLYAVMFG
jgi:hypothetical protein